MYICASYNRITTSCDCTLEVDVVFNVAVIKGARTYCIIKEATPSGVVAMDYFS